MILERSGKEQTVVQDAEDEIVEAVRYSGQRKEGSCRERREQMDEELRTLA